MTECSSRHQGESERGVNKHYYFSKACMEGSPFDRLGGDHSAGPWQRRGTVIVKEALHIQMTPSEEHFNRDGGLEVSGCWIAVMTRQGGVILTDL